ncbi:hypothetical protein BDV96DRAFT_554693 [Lophiotrema nucula]|uniref:Rhodopsin domain-containing protein n=1 Tax=Lophiotrema nucula TaxID=690887 RepID=A0A6A5YQQ0_9PLEO|nr:hypothetical protein BDV96DRAFT_554693 [Lophiotrema nucula]
MSSPWGPPPPGLDITENQNANIIGSVAVVMVIGLSAVALRIFARLSRTGPGLGVDDYVILGAAVLAIGNAACCLSSIQYGGGKHLWVVTLEGFTKLYQTTYAFVIIYINSITLTKTSIMLYYRRIFGTSIVWWIVFCFTIGHGLEVTITWLAGCRPISFYWRQYTDPTAVGSCINASVFYFVNGIIGMLIDVSILLVPIPTVYKLQMPPGQKFFVCGILLLGSFVCVASVVRIVMMDKLVKAHDFTWAMCQVFIWSCVEPFIGILCACLPTFAPLVRRWHATRTAQHSKPSKYYDHSGSNSNNKEWSRIHESATENSVELGSTVTTAAGGKTKGHTGPDPHDIMVTKHFSLSRSP